MEWNKSEKYSNIQIFHYSTWFDIRIIRGVIDY